MAIAITKKKVAQTTEENVTHEGESLYPKALGDMTLEELADSYGSLDSTIKTIMKNPAFAQFELVQKELKSRIDSEMEPEDEAELSGDHWLLEIGACKKNPRKVKDVGKIQAFVGQEIFAKIAKVTISDCEKYLTPEQVAKVIDSDTGYSTTRQIVPKYLG